MNKIIFAGKIPDLHGERVNRCYEIIAPASGGSGGRIECGKLKHGYGGDEIIVIPPNCKYSVIGHGAGDLHVLIENALLNLKEAVVMTDVENNGIHHACAQAEEFLCSERQKSYELVLAALGNLLVGYINTYRDYAEMLSPVTAQVRAELEKHISDPLFSVENYLKKLPLNYDYIRKLFQKEVGLTPHAFLLHARMELAQGLLLGRVSNQYSAYTVSQVAEACGFSEPLYFSRVFKKYFGVSPSEYGK